MRVDCETWIYTTVKESDDTKNPLGGKDKEVTFKKNDDIVIEQKIQLDQQLYSDSGSESDEQVAANGPVVTKIVNDKGLDINFQLVNVS